MSKDQADLSSELNRFEAALKLSQVPARLTTFLTAYYRARGDRVAPRREDLDLRSMSSLLPDISIMERPEPGVVVYRLVGTGVVQRLGLDLTGQNFLDYLSGFDRERIDTGVGVVTEIPCGSFSVYENEYASGSKARAETIAVPLDGGSGKPPYLFMGLHAAQSTIGISEIREQSAIGTRWIEGEVIDLGFGLPDQRTLDYLKTQP